MGASSIDPDLNLPGVTPTLFVAEFKVFLIGHSSILFFDLAKILMLERYCYLVSIHFLASLFVISRKPSRVLCSGLEGQLRVLRVLLDWL